MTIKEITKIEITELNIAIIDNCNSSEDTAKTIEAVAEVIIKNSKLMLERETQLQMRIEALEEKLRKNREEEVYTQAEIDSYNGMGK